MEDKAAQGHGNAAARQHRHPSAKLPAGIFRIEGKLCTKNLVPGKKVYGEELLNEGGVEYRSWNPYRSKLAAAIMNGLDEVPIKEGSAVLYLGAAEGTTASHISDIVGESGIVFGVDISAKVMQRFTWLCEERMNMVPILADANRPETYRKETSAFKIDVLYQDISQRNQAEIFMKNARMHLSREGAAFLVVKARSISAKGSAEGIISAEIEKLKKEFSVEKAVRLKPFDSEHAMALCRKLSAGARTG